MNPSQASDLTPDVTRLVRGLLGGVAEHERGRRKHLEPVGVSPIRLDAVLDVGVVGLAGLQGGVHGECRIGVFGQEGSARL
jgi:hypothetical protein